MMSVSVWMGVALCTSAVAVASSPSAASIARRVTRATDAQLVFETRLADGHGAVDTTVQDRTASRYGTLHEVLGGRYTWHFTQRHPGTIPRRTFAAPTELCSPRH